jgi:hypothetical protein
MDGRRCETNALQNALQDPAQAWVVAKVAAFPGVWNATLRQLASSAELS